MKKMIITWASGDEEEVLLLDEMAERVMLDSVVTDWNNWRIPTDVGCFNMAHAREFRIEDTEE